MARTLAGRRATEAHRLAQTRLGADTVSYISDLWELIDPADLDATVARWLRAALPYVRSQHDASARLAAAYLRTFRSIEAPDATPLRLPPPPTFNPAQAATSLTVTGPVTVRTATGAGQTIDAASDAGLSASARAAMRLALNGGRRAIVNGANADPDAQGWARATSGNPCAFCDMLASRGPVYSEETGDFEAHDGCSCTAEPVYPGSEWPPGARAARALWDESTRGYSGNAAINAFRRARAAT